MNPKIITLSSKTLRKKLDSALESLVNAKNQETIKESYKTLQDLAATILNYAKTERQKSALPEPLSSLTYHLFFDSSELKPKQDDPKTQYVSQEYLDQITHHDSKIGKGQVLGAYDPNTDTIYILNTLTGYEHDKTLKHEKNHRKYPFASEEHIEMFTSAEGYF